MDPAVERRARYEALVREVVEPLRRYALRRTDHAAAEDAVADALLVMWRRLEDVPAGGELPWCYAVTRRCLANVERSRVRQRGLVARIARLDRPDEVAATPTGPDEALHAAMRRLKDDDREVLRLWAWEDLRPQEIAVVLGITANAVSIRLLRAKQRLAAELEADLGAAGEASAAGVAAGRPTSPDARKIQRAAGQMQVDGTADEMGGQR